MEEDVVLFSETVMSSKGNNQTRRLGCQKDDEDTMLETDK